MIIENPMITRDFNSHDNSKVNVFKGFLTSWQCFQSYSGGSETILKEGVPALKK